MTSSLHQVVANGLWFAFDALDVHKTGVVDKVRLKEVTRQVGLTLGLERTVENCLADYRSTDTLSFDQFLHFLEYEVFSDASNSMTPYSELERYHCALDALCWEVGRHSLAPRYPALLSPSDTYKIFRVFCLLADKSSAGGDLFQVKLPWGEVCEVCRQLVEGLGIDWDWADWQMISSSGENFSLPVFLTFLEGRYCQDAEPSALTASVDMLYRMFVGQVLFQGRVYQRITRAGGWLRRDIEVIPWGIRASADTSDDLPDEGGHSHSPRKLTAAVGRSLTLGRSAVGAVGGAMKNSMSEVVERSRTLTRGTPSPTASTENAGGTGKRGFSLGRWGSTSAMDKKRDRERDRDSASLGGRDSPSVASRRSHTLDRATLRNSKSSSTLGGSSPSKSSPGKVISPKPTRETTKGIVGGVIGRVWRLEITPETTVTALKDTSSSRPCKISIINTPTARPIVLAAHDHRGKARLLAALQEAIKHCRDPQPYQMMAMSARREEEAQSEARASEERTRRASQADIIEQTQAELALERTAREEAETLAATEAEGRTAEKMRVKELINLRQQLEALLQQETQAKQDEEIVRNLQARVLREEWTKREELEQLQQEQQRLLEEEQRKRKAFQLLQKEQEKKLKEAEARLRVLDNDKRRLDEELRSAREKIVMSGRGKQVVEAKLKVQQDRRPPIRTLSLRPSRQERCPPARSSSFTTTPTRLAIPSPTSPPTSSLLGSSPIPPHRDSSLSPLGSPNSRSITPSSLPPTGVSPPASTPSTPATTPATTPSGAVANRTILEYLDSSCFNGSNSGEAGSFMPPSSSPPTSTIKSIPEQRWEEEEGGREEQEEEVDEQKEGQEEEGQKKEYEIQNQTQVGQDEPNEGEEYGHKEEYVTEAQETDAVFAEESIQEGQLLSKDVVNDIKEYTNGDTKEEDHSGTLIGELNSEGSKDSASDDDDTIKENSYIEIQTYEEKEETSEVTALEDETVLVKTAPLISTTISKTESTIISTESTTISTPVEQAKDNSAGDGTVTKNTLDDNNTNNSEIET